jgi:hypothetical protein
VEEYTRDFEVVQFQVSMFNTRFDDLFFTSHFINGLKEGLRSAVQSHLPDSVTRASLLAKIQQQRAKHKPAKVAHAKFHTLAARKDYVQGTTPVALWINYP